MSWRKTFDGAEPMRVNKWLAQEGVCSRREAEALIEDGRVSIDGARVADVGRKIAPGETLQVESADQTLAHVTYVLNKPVGYVSAQPEKGQTPAARLLTSANLWGEAAKPPKRDASLAPIGRLDLDSRGLLLLSQDGVLAKAVIGADTEIDKEYEVRIAGPLNERKLAFLRHGLELDGRQLKPAQVTVMGPNKLRFVLNEGRKRQIRRMCEAVELGVTDLKRVRIGPLTLGALPEGRWRLLGAAERAALLKKAR